VIGEKKGHPSFVVVEHRKRTDERAVPAGKNHRSVEVQTAVPLGKFGKLAASRLGGCIIRAAREQQDTEA
jgi:hypothetical protein